MLKLNRRFYFFSRKTEKEVYSVEASSMLDAWRVLYELAPHVVQGDDIYCHGVSYAK